MLVPVSRWSEVGIQLSHSTNAVTANWICYSRVGVSQFSESSHSLSSNCVEWGATGFASVLSVLPAGHRHPTLLQPFPAVMEGLHSTPTHICGLHTLKNFSSVPFGQGKFYPLKATNAGAKIKYSLYSQIKYSVAKSIPRHIKLCFCISLWLDSMMIKIFSNLNDSVFLLPINFCGDNV